MDSIAWLEIFRSFTLVEMLSKIIMPKLLSYQLNTSLAIPHPGTSFPRGVSVGESKGGWETNKKSSPR